MKRVFLSVVFIVLLLITGCSNSSNVVATVNDIGIKEAELDKQMILTEISYNINGVAFPESADALDSLKKEMLANVVESYILVDLAKEKNIEIDEDEAKAQSDSLLEGIISIYGSEENYENFLKEKGQNRADFDEYIFELARSNEYIYNLYDEITQDISVTSEEVKEFYQENIKRYNHSTVSAMTIVLENEKIASTISNEIENKKLDFEDAMKQNEEKEGVIQSLDLGEIYYGNMSEEFSEKAFSMNTGEISKPFKSQDAYYIIYVYDKDEQEAMDYDEIKDTVEIDLLSQKKSSEYQQFFKTAKESYEIQISLP